MDGFNKEGFTRLVSWLVEMEEIQDSMDYCKTANNGMHSDPKSLRLLVQVIPKTFGQVDKERSKSGYIKTMAKKIRELIQDLVEADFYEMKGKAKGSHRRNQRPR